MPKRRRDKIDTTWGILILGFSEGFVAPIVEGCIAIISSSMVTITEILSKSTSSQSMDLLSFIAVFGILSLLESFLFGLIRNWWEVIGYCIGAILGVYILANLINAVFPGAILATVFSIIIIVLGVGVRIWLLTIRSNSGENYDYEYP